MDENPYQPPTHNLSPSVWIVGKVVLVPIVILVAILGSALVLPFIYFWGIGSSLFKRSRDS